MKGRVETDSELLVNKLWFYRCIPKNNNEMQQEQQHVTKYWTRSQTFVLNQIKRIHARINIVLNRKIISQKHQQHLGAFAKRSI